MAIDKNTLLELYKISLEEARHRDRLYTQTWMAVAITGSVLVAALGFFLKQISVISGCWIMSIMIVLGLIFGFFFTYSVFRLAKEGDICRGIASTIEDALLTGREQSERPELEGLLVRQKIEHDEREGFARVKWAFSGQGWRRVYPGTIFLAWIAFCIFLFICID